MSIDEEIIDGLIADERILRVEPIVPGGPQPRCVFATPEVFQQIDDFDDNPNSKQLRAWLDNFTKGNLVVIGNRKSKTADMKLLEPESDEIWEIRKTESPSTRMFGRFIKKDVFLVLGICTVSELFSIIQKTKLGEFWPVWNREIQNTKAKWRQLFPSYNPHTGDSLSDYISRATDERDL